MSMIDEELDRDMIPAVNKRRLLWGFLSFESAIATLRRGQQMLNPLQDGEDLDGDTLRGEWETARNSINDVRELENPSVEPFPNTVEIAEHIDRLTQMDFFKQTYGNSDTTWDFGLVPLEKIVALQGSVVATAHREIPDGNEDFLSTLEYVFPIEREQGFFTQTIQTEDNELLGVQLTSRAPNVSVSNLRMLEGDQPMEKQVLFTVRAPPNLVNCTRFENRLYLNNGYHRAFQLLQKGATHLPAIIRESEEFPETVGDLPKDVVLSDRPPLLRDFDTEAAITYRLPATNELIRITAESTKVFR